MNNKELKIHDDYRQLSIYSYDVNKNKLPPGYELIGISTMDNGFYAVVVRKGNEIVISYRGTQGFEDIEDLKNDGTMWPLNRMPSQAYNALNLYERIKYEYPDCEISVTGHSLGGSLAQIVGAIKNVTAVTFNAYGTANLLAKEKGIGKIYSDKITTKNAKNHIGRCYELKSKDTSEKGPHFIESFEPLENRIPTTGEDLQWELFKKQKAESDFDYYMATGKHRPIYISSTGFYNPNCAGTYQVSGYTRNDGTKVSGYERTFGAKHLAQLSASEKYRGRRFDELTNTEIDELLDEFI